MRYTLRSPVSEQDWTDYFQLRWRILRAPWQQPPGSERDELEDSAFHLMAVDENSKTVATGRLHRLDDDTAQIRYMAVIEELQGCGLGSRILQQLEHTARDWHCRQIALNARNSCLGFYQKHGYEVIAEAPTLFGSIAHKRMRKRLV